MRYTGIQPRSGHPLLAIIFLVPLLASTPLLHAQAPLAGVSAPAPGQDSYLCRYYGQKDAHPIMYVTPIIHESTLGHLPDRFYTYMQTTYDFSKIQHGTEQCRRVFNDAAGQANTMDMLEKQWAASKTEVIHLTWTDSAAENAAIDAKAASAASSAASAATAAMPPARADEYYVVCASGRDGPVVYYSDIFAAAPPPGTPPTRTKSGPVVMFPTGSFRTPFFTFLQRKYGFQGSGNYPVECGADFPPTAAGFQNAQRYKLSLQDQTRQNKAQIVETGWENQ